ncbi:DUF1614 domain-containing protein [Acidianus sulfidivorans JP7]|uniref:DUF1614 domain-containing protein n=1 Tax=Acidianus sulfidivorans JP7 TaxID=619593 RepID=A0A2U9IKA0_9CREN|nr:DUF1614 domain-containing protein [Acidianus sulfidivorans JP7]
MLKRIIIFSQYRGIMFPIYILLALFLMIISIGYFKDVLLYIGISRKLSYILAFEISILSFALSPVNLVVKEVKREALVPRYDVIYVFGIPFYVPKLSQDYLTTLIAVNFGGAIIPLLLSITLLFLTLKYILLTIVDIIFLIIISKLFSKVVEGVGVVMHPFIPPIFSVIFSYILFFHYPQLVPVAAYISSVIGTLVGADLLNLNNIIEASPQIVSIGGMGSFDGIFLSGLFSIVFGELIIALL